MSKNHLKSIRSTQGNPNPAESNIFAQEIKKKFNKPEKLYLPCDNLSGKIFEKNPKSDVSYELSEKNNVQTAFKISNLHEPLTLFDKGVLSVCLSEQAAENEFTTIRRIYQLMGGSHTLTAELKNSISSSLDKLAQVQIEIDMQESQKLYHADEYSFKGSILPCERLTAKFRGQIVKETIHFLGKSPLQKVAELKKQIITCDLALLDILNFKNNEFNFRLKFYLLERILFTKGSCDPKRKKRVKKLQPIILFDTLFEKLNIPADIERWKQQDIRNSIKKIMDYFKAQNLISDWRFEKKFDKFYSIEFQY